VYLAGTLVECGHWRGQLTLGQDPTCLDGAAAAAFSRMPTYGKVAIIGVGLIGGSIGLALRQRGLANCVVGIGRRQSSLDRALACHAIDEACSELSEGVADAELVVVATPVNSVADCVCDALAAATDKALVTDAGSTKMAICQAVEARMPSAAERFVGSHPLAGDHRTGPEYAREDLLEGRTVVLTPGGLTSTETIAEVEALWRSLGAHVMKLPPVEHDEALALTSHLPHLAASALAAVTPEKWLGLTATGWADTTRIAASDPELWTQVLGQNRSAVLESLRRFNEHLKKIETELRDENWPELRDTLHDGKRKRDALGN